jgi:uncharacterized protein YgbK (DUF1537 family)
MSERLLGVIADDLTGAVELAAMLVSRGVRTGLTIGAAAPLQRDDEAHVIALKSRVAPVAQAVEDVRAAADRLLNAGYLRLFFKYCATFDSTPRGNIGPCAEALLERLDTAFTLFCPAYCENGRSVFQGHMFAGSTLLSESPKRFDPLTPMTDANLLRVLQAQSRVQVGLVPHEVVQAGAAAITRRVADLRASGAAFAIIDAIYERDLATIAEASADLPLMTGNSSVCAYFPPVWRQRGLLGAPAQVTLPGVASRAAILAGSCADRTAEQLVAFETIGPVLRLDLLEAFAGADLVAHATEWAGQHISAGPVAIATTAGPQAVAALQERYGIGMVATRAEQILSAIARTLVGQLGVRRLIVAGGETAGAVLGSLGITRLTVGAYGGPGWSRVLAQCPESDAPLAMVLKSGKLGPVEMLRDVCDVLSRPETTQPSLDEWPPAAHPTPALAVEAAA